MGSQFVIIKERLYKLRQMRVGIIVWFYLVSVCVCFADDPKESESTAFQRIADIVVPCLGFLEWFRGCGVRSDVPQAGDHWKCIAKPYNSQIFFQQFTSCYAALADWDSSVIGYDPVEEGAGKKAVNNCQNHIQLIVTLYSGEKCGGVELRLANCEIETCSSF